MAISGKIVSLKDGQDLNIFPETAASAVYMSNGKTVEEAINAGGGGGTGSCSITFEETSESIVMNNPDMISKIGELGVLAEQNKNNIEKINIKNEGYINILSMGADNSGELDSTSAFQKAIDLGGRIYIPNGIYIIDTIYLKSNIIIHGESKNAILKSKANSTNKGMIMLEKNNVVQNIEINNISLHGDSTNPLQYALFFEATPTIDSPYHGGLWNSRFLFIDILGFGNGMALLAKSNGLLPIQGLYFERCEFRVDTNINEGGCACLMEGQTEQLLFNQCSFSGNHIAKGTSMILRRERLNDEINGDAGTHSKSFIQCYFGNTLQGVTFERTTDTRFNNCFFENSSRCLTITASSENIIFDGNNFYECGKDIVGIGYLIKGDNDNCKCTFINNRSIGTNYTFKQGYLSIFCQNNKIAGSRDFENPLYGVNIVNNIIEIKSKYILIQNSQDLRFITSDFSHGDEIILLPRGGDINIRTDMQGFVTNFEKNMTLINGNNYKFTMIGNTWFGL